jgi:hypothetical protein
MNKREFVCRMMLTVMQGNEGSEKTAAWAWKTSEMIWDARPQWMKDEENVNLLDVLNSLKPMTNETP